ncbi:MAG: hypothetical protein Q8L48_37635 [Archangium sp.]|nr:hypothetical protein [Archangium sp.]
MAAGDGKPKPGPLAPKPPQMPRAKPRGTSDSAFELAPVGGATSRSAPSFPRVPTSQSMKAANPFGAEEKTKTSMQDLPRVGGASSNNLQPVGPRPALVQPPRRKSNVIQKRLASSGFDEEERTQIDAMLGRSKSVELDLDEEIHTNTNEFYDGETPAEEVVDKETWRAVKAPVQSRPKRRSGRTLWSVIDQFAVGNNPRYSVISPAADPRAHVFTWDVSMAMECEIPHNRGGREMTLAQTVDWVRLECIYRGWRKIDSAGALAAADRGELVVAISRDTKARALAIVRPGGAGDDGLPRVASAGRPRGNDLSVAQAIGPAVDFYTHP